MNLRRLFQRPGPARHLRLLTVLLLSGVSAPGGPEFANGVSQGTVSIAGLTEASGLVASRNNPGVLWTHNDAGDSARLFALDSQGRKLGVYLLPAATNVDWEDIALGPGPVTNVLYLYVGDIGDNTSVRANIQVYQVPEPAMYGRQYLNPVTRNLKGVRCLTLTYPDGPHNAEALFVDPWTGDLFVAIKQNGTSGIYLATRAQLDAADASLLTFVRSVGFDSVSAADISPTGTEIIFRQEDYALLWTRARGQSVAGALAGMPISVPVIGRPTEPNGEAVAFDYFGSGYYTLSDSASSQPLYYFRRLSPDGPRAPQVLLPAGAAWSYLDDGSDPGTAWRQPGYPDASWSRGEGQFGYGDGDEKTVVSYGGNPNSKHITTYFRTTFALPNAPCLSAATLRLLVDDGAAVFLNGVAVADYHLAPDAAFTTPALAAQPTNLEDTWLSFPVDPRLLVNGTNTLAVEVHLAATNSPNLSFDVELVATECGAARFTSAALEGDGFHLSFCGPALSNVTIQASPDLVNWTDLGNVVLTDRAATFQDPQASNYLRRYYRIAGP